MTSPHSTNSASTITEWFYVASPHTVADKTSPRSAAAWPRAIARQDTEKIVAIRVSAELSAGPGGGASP